MRLIPVLRRVRSRFTSPFGPLYDEARLLPALRRSLRFVIVGNICGGLFATITTGSALTGFAGALGANDMVYGVLTALPAFGTLLQIPAAILVSRSGNRKKYMLTYGLLSRALWLLVGMVPFFVPVNPGWLRIWSAIFLIGVASLSSSFINVCFTPMLADLVPIRIRGRWISARDRITSVLNIVVGLLTAQLLDIMPGHWGYLVVFLLAGVTGVVDMLCFIPVEDHPAVSPKTNFLHVIGHLVRNRTFFVFMLFWTVWCLTSNLAGPYFNRYALDGMGLSFLQVTLCGQVANALVTVLVISRWGRLIDRYGSKPTLWISCLATAFSPLFMLFAVPGNPVTFLLYNLVGATFWCGANLTATNMLLSSSPDGQRPAYVAIYSCFTSLAGTFVGVLLGGALLQWIPDLLGSWGIVADQYKLLFALCVVTRTAAVLLFLPRMNNDREGSVADVKRDLQARLRGR